MKSPDRSLIFALGLVPGIFAGAIEELEKEIERLRREQERERLLTEYGRLNSEEFGKQIDSEKVVQRWARFRDDCVLFVLYDGPSEAPVEPTRQEGSSS